MNTHDPAGDVHLDAMGGIKDQCIARPIPIQLLLQPPNNNLFGKQ
jgi:hypothetical protein